MRTYILLSNLLNVCLMTIQLLDFKSIKSYLMLCADILINFVIHSILTKTRQLLYILLSSHVYITIKLDHKDTHYIACAGVT
jgi:hypothetical protein